MSKSSVLVGGIPVAAGGYGCVFDPALKCNNTSLPYDPTKISKLMISKYAKDEKKEILKFAPILSSIPNAEKYFILNINSCTPAPLSNTDLKDFDRKCKNFKNHPEFRAVNMKKKSTLNKLLILNMLNGGVDIDMYLIRKPVNSEKIFNIVYGIKDIINNAILPMNKLGLYHLDLKPANIVIDRNNQMRIIDWGLSDIVKNTKLPVNNLSKPIQYNNPFYMVFANELFFSSYESFLKTSKNPNKEYDNFIKQYYLWWEQNRGSGHTEYIKILLNGIYSNRKLTTADTRNIIIINITVMIKTYTDFKTKTFDHKQFMEILYHNIDIWGALISLAMIFYPEITKNIEIEAKKKSILLSKIKKLLDTQLFFKFNNIDIKQLNTSLDDIMLTINPSFIPQPSIKNVPTTPKSNPPQLLKLSKTTRPKKTTTQAKPMLPKVAQQTKATNPTKNQDIMNLWPSIDFSETNLDFQIVEQQKAKATQAKATQAKATQAKATQAKATQKKKTTKPTETLDLMNLWPKVTFSPINGSKIPAVKPKTTTKPKTKKKKRKLIILSSGNTQTRKLSATKPKSKHTSAKVTRVPSGTKVVNVTHRNHKTQTTNKRTTKKRKPRCPNGTRRNPKTGLCDPNY